jgi:hypothetical protein
MRVCASLQSSLQSTPLQHSESFSKCDRRGRSLQTTCEPRILLGVQDLPSPLYESPTPNKLHSAHDASPIRPAIPIVPPRPIHSLPCFLPVLGPLSSHLCALPRTASFTVSAAIREKSPCSALPLKTGRANAVEQCQRHAPSRPGRCSARIPCRVGARVDRVPSG